MNNKPNQKWLLLMVLSFFIFMPPTFLTFKTEMKMLTELPLMLMNSCQIELSTSMDVVSNTMLLLVSLISTNVIFFSHYYLDDKDEKKFYFILVLFILSMMVFSMSTNTMAMMLGWDGLGISSFMLVAHYPTWPAAASSMVTMFTNRIGDVLIILAMMYMMENGQWNLTHQANMNWKPLTLLLMAAATKSAQIPFNLWLPEAMAAPTPVSALVHSSTLVTAGILLVTRIEYLIDSKSIIMVMWTMGVLTTLSAGLVASYMKDPKKVIAYSTMSQLGMMSMTMAMGYPMITLFHLVTHAMFKALMFISMGMTIAHNKHKQIPTSNMNTLNSAPSASFKISTMALNAFPFTAGFFSKELMLESVMAYWSEIFTTAIILPTALTTTYSLRLIKNSTITKSKMSSVKMSTMNKHTTSKKIPMALTTQTLLSVIMGAAMANIMNPTHPPLNSLIQTTTLSSMSMLGAMILMIQMFNNLTTNKYSNKLLLSSYSNMAMWWGMEKLTHLWLMNSFMSYKMLEKGSVMNLINMINLPLYMASSQANAYKKSSLKFILISPSLFILIIMFMY